jgi:exodeoxyribonuclease VII small subunit
VSPTSKERAEPEPSFDQRLARLEAIVAELEGGEIALEPAIARYQEGVEILKSCRGLLEGFQKRVEELSAAAEGGVAPYAGDPDAEREQGRRGSRGT